MTREWLRKWCEHEYAPSFVSEAIDYFVDYVVKESARERAHRRWRMDEEEPSSGTDQR
jgi:hypothetical protein